MPTYTPKASEITRDWVIVDADGLVLGRLATEVARILRGKHKVTFAPHMDMGDHVIIINADKVVLTSGKAEKKKIYRHSGFPGGIKEQTFADLLDRKPEEAVRRSVRGMLPHNRLGRAQLRKLKVYAGPSHPHAAQQPKVLELDPGIVVGDVSMFPEQTLRTVYISNVGYVWRRERVSTLDEVPAIAMSELLRDLKELRLSR